MKGSGTFERLLAFLEKLPAIDLPAGRKSIGHGKLQNGNWWVKFTLNTNHDLAWRHVQELGFVLGGVEFLSWVIESKDPTFLPDQCAEWLEGRLPRPVDDPEQWNMEP
jgi:hypothetical protein